MDHSLLLLASSSPTERAWAAVDVPVGFGVAGTRHKWRQGLIYVEVFVRLPDSISPKQVCVVFWGRGGERGGWTHLKRGGGRGV